MPAYPTFPSPEGDSIIGSKRFYFSVPTPELLTLNSRQTLLSHQPRPEVSSGLCAFIALFGMGRDGTHKAKSPGNHNEQFGAGQGRNVPDFLNERSKFRKSQSRLRSAREGGRPACRQAGVGHA